MFNIKLSDLDEIYYNTTVHILSSNNDTIYYGFTKRSQRYSEHNKSPREFLRVLHNHLDEDVYNDVVNIVDALIENDRETLMFYRVKYS